MRKLLSYFLVIILTIMAVGTVDVNADKQDLNWNGFIYQVHNDTVTHNKHILIEDYVGTDKHIIFPKEIEGIPVEELAEKFVCTSNITSVTISDTMQKPEGLAWCETLEKVLVDDSSTKYTVIDGILYDRKVTKLLCYPCAKQDSKYIVPKTVVESYGFQQLFSNNEFLKEVTFTSVKPDCSNTEIENVKIAGDVTYVPENAFAHCKKLKKVDIGKKVTYIERDAFYDCTSLKAVKLSDNLRSIYGSAFSNTKISKVKIPKSVDYIGYNVFPHKTKIKGYIG